MFGLKTSDITTVKAILSEYSEVEEAVVFGSRAMGNYRPGSDVDLALKGDSIGFSTVRRISGILNEETNMPYQFDVVHYGAIENSDLREHIDRVGKRIYIRTHTVRKAGEPEARY
jgi:predicted nucleotidyltransferase